jgi:hypothetical protein
MNILSLSGNDRVERFGWFLCVPDTSHNYIDNKIVYILYFEQDLVLRNSIRFWVGSFSDAPSRDP